MKACIKCRAELPDSAGHCVYCGTAQAAPSSGPNSTMMGHPGMAEELIARAEGGAPQARPSGVYDGMMPATKLSISEQEKVELDALVSAGRSQQAQASAPAQSYGAPPGQAPGQPYGGQPQRGPQPYGGQPQGGAQPYGQPQGGQPQGGQPQGGQPQGGQPQGGIGQPYGGPGHGGPQQPYGAPNHGNPQQPYGAPNHGNPQQPYGGQPQGGPPQPYGAPPQHGAGARGPAPFGGANLGIQNAQFGAAAHQPPRAQFGGQGHYQDAMTAQVKPLRAPGHFGDVSGWDDSLTTQMLVFGVLLVACFVAPWAVGGGKTVFAWSVLSVKGATFVAKMLPILLAVTGVVSVALGALKLSTTARAFAAVAIGLSPIVFQLATADPLPWQIAVALVSTLLMVSGLVVRSRFTGLMLGRVLATVGVVGMLALYLVPENDVMPIKMLIDGLADMPGSAKVVPIVGAGMSGVVIGIIPLLLTLACLLVWLPESSKAGAPILTWAILFWPLIAALTLVLVSENMLATIKANLSMVFYLPLARVAWMALASFGIAGIISQRENG